MNPNTIDKNIYIRDRDINWWSKLPIGWRVKKLKYISLIQLSNVDKLSIEGQEIVFLCNYTDVYKNEKIVSTLPFMQATATDEQIKRLSIQKSDVLLTKDSETPDDIGIPAIVAEEITGVVCGYHLALSRPNPDMVHSGFLFRAIQSQPIKRYFFVNSVGMTRYGLDKQAIAETPIPLPSLSIQKAIAEYLDREIAYIDALVDTKRRLLDLLTEKRQTLILHTITHGLNSNVPMRNTGIPWMGKIPENWKIKRLKFCAKINPSSVEVNNLSGDIDVSFIPMNLIGFGSLDSTQAKPLASLKQGFTYFREGDVLIAKITPSFENLKGTIAQNLINGIGFGTTELHVVRPYNEIDGKFLYYITISYAFRHIGEGMMEGTAGQKRVPAEFIQDFPCALPPLSEQKLIVESLEEEIKKIDLLYNTTHKSIILLNERRAALISAAVTGQIEIPEASCN